jgi:CBS domain-containing protein
MLRLRDIMTRDVVTVAPELSVRDAMTLFTTRHISGAPVLRSGKLVGVVTLTDLAELAAGSPGVPTVRDEIPDDSPLEHPGDWVDDDIPSSAFFAEMWEDSGADSDERMRQSSSPEWNPLEELTVGEAMSRRIAALPSSTPVDHAAAAMRRAAIHRVLVVDDGQLVGIVSTKDVSDAVADHRVNTNVYVFGKAATRAGG